MHTLRNFGGEKPQAPGDGGAVPGDAVVGDKEIPPGVLAEEPI